MHWLTWAVGSLPLLATVSPLIGALSVTAVSRRSPLHAQSMARASALLTLLLLGATAWNYEPHRVDERGRPAVSQMETRLSWLAESSPAATGVSPSSRRGIEVQLAFGIDGLTLWPAVWLALVVWVAVAVPSSRSEESSSAQHVALLLSQSGLLASLTGRDAVTSVFALEMSLPALYLLIGRWGGRERRAAADRFLICQLAGCGLTLLGTTLLAVSWPWVRSDFDVRRSPLAFDSFGLIEGLRSMVARNEVAVQLWSDLAPWGCVLLVLGFAIRLPGFPFHDWYVTTLEEAPAGVAGLVAISLPQVAFCGWVRFAMPLLVEQAIELSWLLGLVASVGALHAGFRAASQTALRPWVAALSFGWLALALLTMRLPTRAGLAGAWLLVQSQGLAIAALCLLIGLWHVKSDTRVSGSGQIAAVCHPRLTALFFAVLAGSGLMSCGGTAGSFLTLSLLTWEQVPFAACGIAVSLLLTWSMLNAVQQWSLQNDSISEAALSLTSPRFPLARSSTLDGSDQPSNKRDQHAIPDLTYRELFALSPLVLTLFWLALSPALLIKSAEPTLAHLLERTERRSEAASLPSTESRKPEQ